MKTKIILLIAALLCSFIFSYAQSDSLRIKTFGLGVHVEQFKISDIGNNAEYFTPNKIILTFTFENHFRIEPEFGYRTATNNVSKNKESALGLGIGIVGMFQHGRVSFPIGIQFKDDIFTESSTNSSGNINKITTTVFSAGPVVGAEYFLGDNFSVAGDIGLMFSSVSSKHDPAVSGQEIDVSEFNTDTGLKLRFYF